MDWIDMGNDLYRNAAILREFAARRDGHLLAAQSHGRGHVYQTRPARTHKLTWWSEFKAFCAEAWGPIARAV
jgi:hypothetical protein